MNKLFIRLYTGIGKRFGDRRRWNLIRRYRLVRGRKPDFDNPTDFSEYIMAGMLYERNNENAVYADKVKVKAYLESKGLKDLVPKCLGVWDNSSQIDYDLLPDKFVLKINHGCGYNLFCWDKATFDKEAAGIRLDKWLYQTYSETETHYNHIEPKIFAEEFIDDFSGEYPVDYRIYCFNGKPALLDCTVWPDKEHKITSLLHYIIDTEWNYRPEYSTVVHDDWEKRLPRPKNLDKMLEYAAELSKELEFVRVDLYDTGSKVYFAEMTLTPGAGEFKQFTDLALRDMYKLLKA